MKSLFAAFVLSFVTVFSVFAGDDGTQSVLQQPADALATAPETPFVSAPAVAVCATGNCTTERSSRSSCRAGLFCRTIERTRTVTRAVVEVPVKVVTAPVRVFRARRGCCCN